MSSYDDLRDKVSDISLDQEDERATILSLKARLAEFERRNADVLKSVKAEGDVQRIKTIETQIIALRLEQDLLRLVVKLKVGASPLSVPLEVIQKGYQDAANDTRKLDAPSLILLEKMALLEQYVPLGSTTFFGTYNYLARKYRELGPFKQAQQTQLLDVPVIVSELRLRFPGYLRYLEDMRASAARAPGGPVIAGRGGGYVPAGYRYGGSRSDDGRRDHEVRGGGQRVSSRCVYD